MIIVETEDVRRLRRSRHIAEHVCRRPGKSLHPRYRSRTALLPRSSRLRQTFRTPAEGIPEHVELQLNGFTVGLGTVEAAKRVHGVEAAPGIPAMVLVVWTDDVDRACEELAAAGVPVLQPPHNTGNNNRNALPRDPDGNLVEIVAKVS
jgi:lactoylglutathione lyase